MSVLLGALIGYFMGSIPCGLVFVKAICGIDIRQYGSHNIGTTNVFRTVGARMASLVLLGDLGKGVVALLLVSRFVSTDLWPQLACAAASILGHSFSCFLHFKGGRGVATGLGVLLYFMPDVSVLPSPYGLPSSLSHAMSRWVPLWLPFAHLLAPII